MYETLVLIWKNEKYLLNYNTSCLSLSIDLPEILAKGDSPEEWNDYLCEPFDSYIDYYQELNLDEE